MKCVFARHQICIYNRCNKSKQCQRNSETFRNNAKNKNLKKKKYITASKQKLRKAELSSNFLLIDFHTSSDPSNYMKGCKYDQNGTRHLCNCTWPAWSQPHQAMQDTLTSTNMRAKAPYILILTQSSKSMKWCIEHCSMWAQISRWSTCIWKEEESCPQLRSFFFVSFWPQDYPWGKGKTGVQSPRILLSDYHVYNQKIIKSCCLKGEWIHMGGKKCFL